MKPLPMAVFNVSRWWSFGASILCIIGTLSSFGQQTVPAADEPFYLRRALKELESAMATMKDQFSVRRMGMPDRRLGELLFTAPSHAKKEVRQPQSFRFTAPLEYELVISGPLAAGDFPADFAKVARARFQADYPSEKFDRETVGDVETINGNSVAATLIIGNLYPDFPRQRDEPHHEYLGIIINGHLYIFEFHSPSISMRSDMVSLNAVRGLVSSTCDVNNVKSGDELWLVASALTRDVSKQKKFSAESEALIHRGQALVSPLRSMQEREAGLQDILAAKNLGDARAMTLLAMFNEMGLTESYDPKREFDLLSSAGDLFYGPALFMLAELYQKGRHVRIDAGKAGILRHAAYLFCVQQESEIDPLPSLTIGKMIDGRLCAPASSHPRLAAISYYQKAAELGNLEADRKLAYGHVNGMFSPRNVEKALELWRKSGQEGDSESVRLYATFVAEKDPGQSSQYLEKAAAWGNAAAFHQLALLQLTANKHQRNYSKAYHLFEQAAKRGHAESMYQLWLMSILEYPGVPPHNGVQIEWCEKSALAGSFSGMYALGWIYSGVFSGRTDLEESRYWFRTANTYGGRYELAAVGKTIAMIEKQRVDEAIAFSGTVWDALVEGERSQAVQERAAFEDSVRRNR